MRDGGWYVAWVFLPCERGTRGSRMELENWLGNCIGRRNILHCITEEEDFFYAIPTANGRLHNL